MNYTNDQGHIFPLVKLKGMERLPKEEAEIIYLLEEYFVQAISKILEKKEDISKIDDKVYKELMDDTVMGSLSSGYIARAANVMPKQGKHAPWKVSNNYLADRKTLKSASFEDGVLKFAKRNTTLDQKPKLVS